MRGRDKPLRLQNLAGISVDAVGDMADAAEDRVVLRLENLDTDIAPAPVVLEKTRLAITDDKNNSYLPFAGQLRLRNAVAAHVSRMSGVPYEAHNVIICAGGLSGILNVLLALVDRDDEVVLTDPTYIGLTNRVRIAGAVPTFVPFINTGNGWLLDVDELARVVTPRTRALLLMSPSMPSGAYLQKSDWDAVAHVAEEHGLWVIYDAAMERILFDGRPVIHPASIPGLAPRLITVGSASKELRMIGWRVGWIVAPERMIDDIRLVSMANVVVPVGISQEAAAAALELGDDDVAAAVAIWQQRRDILLRELAWLPAIKPAGGWSLLLDGTAVGMTGAELSHALFQRGRIAATPMDGWGIINGKQFLRLVFSNEPVQRLRGLGERVRAALHR
jgi:N-succinyldiaminopimelate aminotransferase